jgi:hypothetical protein
MWKEREIRETATRWKMSTQVWKEEKIRGINRQTSREREREKEEERERDNERYIWKWWMSMTGMKYLFCYASNCLAGFINSSGYNLFFYNNKLERFTPKTFWLSHIVAGKARGYPIEFKHPNMWVKHSSTLHHLRE